MAGPSVTPAQIISAVAALMNDVAQQRYTNAAVLPYLNMALDILQEVFEQNSLPMTSETTSSAITVPSSTNINTFIGFNTTPPLPANLIEIQEVWESPSGQNQWTRMDKRDYIPHYLENGQQISQFLIWAWEQQNIVVISANQDNDIKIDYIANLFDTPLTIGSINVALPYINIKTFLEFETAALCAYFIAENESRAGILEGKAASALDRSLGIQVKALQSISIRRKPFRSSYKTRGRTFL